MHHHFNTGLRSPMWTCISEEWIKTVSCYSTGRTLSPPTSNIIWGNISCPHFERAISLVMANMTPGESSECRRFKRVSLASNYPVLTYSRSNSIIWSLVAMRINLIVTRSQTDSQHYNNKCFILECCLFKAIVHQKWKFCQHLKCNKTFI